MSNKEFNSRTHQSQTNRQLISGAIVLILLIGLSFVAFRMGTGALLFAIGTFAVIGVMIVLVWLALKVIELVAGKDE
jgi:hypothetical protein